MSSKVWNFFSELYKFRYALSQLVIQQLILRYRRTALGYLWTLINPLLMMSVMAVVFSSLFKSDLKTFAVFLFGGMIPWTYFSSVVAQSSSSLINNEGLIKKIYIPKGIFPLSIALGLMIDSLFSFVALFFIILAVGGSLSLGLLFLPVSFLLLFLFAFGVGLILSIATVFFRDFQHIINIALQGLFFLTPILYKHEHLDGKLGLLVSLNPVTPYISLFRAPLVEGSFPDINILIQTTVISVLAVLIGLLVFLSHDKKIIFRM
jgi:ABC-type polysaccharide/polyol phosphate export permease